MALSVPAPLPTFTLSQIQAPDTDHLETAATHWTATAARWRDGFTAVSSGIDRPGGTAWEGASAEAASAGSERDRVQVLGLVDRLHDASSIARSGAAELTAAKTRALASVDNAQRAGFTVSEDLSVRDTLTVHSKPLQLIRDMQAQVFAADIRAQSTILAATDQTVASKLSTITAGFTGFEFRESPFPQEPPPPQMYRQDNNTFAVERTMYPINEKGEITGPSTWKVHVVISASDGHIITAYPMSTK